MRQSSIARSTSADKGSSTTIETSMSSLLSRALIFTLFSLFIILFLVPYYGFKKQTDFFPVIGGVIGAVCSLIVMIGIYLNPKERGSPAMTLLFWRTFCDFGLAIRFVANDGFNRMVCDKDSCFLSTDLNDQGNCYIASTMTQFFEIASEGWLLMVPLDLYFSITQPFSSFKSRLFYYRIAVFIYAFAYSVPTFTVSTLYGFWSISSNANNAAICWIQLGNTASAVTTISFKPYVMLYIPVFLIYLFCIGVLSFAYFRLKKGITRTIAHRLKALITNSINISVYLLYWVVLGTFYGFSYISIENGNVSGATFLFTLTLYVISAKGFTSILVWIIILNVNIGGEESGERLDLNKALREEVLHYATDGIKKCVKKSGLLNDPNNHSTHEVLSNEIEDNSFPDLTVIFFIKLVFGMQQQVQRVNLFVRQTSSNFAPKANSRRSLAKMDRQSQISAIANSAVAKEDDIENKSNIGIALGNMQNSESRTSQPIFNHPDNGETDEDSELEKSNKHNDVTFTEYEPYHFRRVRAAAGISEELYVSEFETTIKQRLIEGGASGAFFFLSKNEIFLAKSCTEEELGNLKGIASEYATYLETNKGSFICRIFGAYTLRIYSTSLNFFVMNNLFLNAENAVMHEKYDIKGSWVARSATPPREGQIVSCTHCEKSYVYHRKAIHKNNLPAPSFNSTASAQTPFNMSFITSLKNFLGMSKPRDEVKTPVEIDDSIICKVTANGIHVPNIVLKDNDLKHKIRLPDNDKVTVAAQLRKDAEFLESIGVMDFSLLVGVHNTDYEVNPAIVTMPDINPSFDSRSDKEVTDPESLSNHSETTLSPIHGNRPRAVTSPQNQSTTTRTDSSASNQGPKTRRIQVSRVVGPESYYMGIIDYQQKWNLSKKMERFFKINFKRADPNGLSAMEPEAYRDRFIRHIEDILDVEEHSAKNPTESLPINV